MSPRVQKMAKRSPTPRTKTAQRRPERPPAAEPQELSREGWLLRASELLLPFVRQAAAWAGVPSTLTVPPQVACSWPPGRSTTLLSCSSMHASAGHWEITLSPAMGAEWNLSRTSTDLVVLTHLTHELVHCVADDADSHQGAFAEVAASVGLLIPLPEPTASTDLQAQLTEQVIKRIGHYPHYGMLAPPRRPGQNRQKKWTCEHCGKIVRCAGGLQALHLCEDGQQGRFILAEKS